jgi:hypothetical protein
VCLVPTICFIVPRSLISVVEKNIGCIYKQLPLITNDAKCAREIRSGIVMEKAAFNFFHKEIGLRLKEETSKVLHLVEYRFIWW